MFKRFRKKIQKVKEGMILAHTFKSGERLWTYRMKTKQLSIKTF